MDVGLVEVVGEGEDVGEGEVVEEDKVARVEDVDVDLSQALPWQTASTSTDVAPTAPTFTSTPGPHLELPTNPQPVNFLEQVLDEDLLGLVIEETNTYVKHQQCH